jgi:methyl-accepting chemotaxis protein
MKIRTKIIGLGVGSATAVGLALGCYMMLVSGQASDRRIAELDRTLRADFDRNARLEVETAISMLKPFADRTARGEMPMDQAKKAGADLLRQLRYDKEGYFWADTVEGVNVVFPGREEVEGKSRIDSVDAKGNHFIRDIITAGRGGGGFSDYYFPKKGGTIALLKRAYSLEFTPFGWVVGTGNYVDDIDALLAAERATAERDRLQQYTAIGAVGIVVTALAALVAMLLGRSTSRPLAFMVEEMARLRGAVADGQLDVRGDASKIGAEFRPIVDGMNATMDAFVAPIKVTADYVARISRGDLPPGITAEYKGDFNLIKQSLNQCIDAVGALVEDAKTLAGAAMAGELSTRADVSRHQGDFRKVVEGVNATLDAVLGPIAEASQVLEQLAKRDLRSRMNGDYRGDHTRIKQALNATAEALHGAMAQVAQAATQVSSASSQIAASSQTVASGASEQASSLEETGSSLESMSSMAKHAADNAQQASGLASTAKAAAADGSAAMQQMTEAMARIQASAEGTSQIIKDINEIAFQTNLLALNAAVEAARAGEAGRGFAVVAEEVRSLALRSKEAANKTEELIRQSVREAGEGAATARHVGEKLSQIVGGVSKVTDIVAEIAATSKEQASGIDRVNTAMGQMNTVTQQNAASSEELSSTAEELSAQSAELESLVATFQLDAGATTDVRPSTVRKPAAARPARDKSPARRPAPPAALHPKDVFPLDDMPRFKDF